MITKLLRIVCDRDFCWLVDYYGFRLLFKNLDGLSFSSLLLSLDGD